MMLECNECWHFEDEMRSRQALLSASMLVISSFDANHNRLKRQEVEIEKSQFVRDARMKEEDTWYSPSKRRSDCRF